MDGHPGPPRYVRRLLALATKEVKDLIERALNWAGSDPDPATKSEIEGLAQAGDVASLEMRFSPELVFGTAGIRGMVGAGPARMNRAVVIRTTYGLAECLANQANQLVVVGFDARPTSRQFAEDTAGVLAASGFSVLYFPHPTPTPLVAFAARIYDAAAAVVITASHNPPADNGYKVYGANAAQIIPPLDREIEDLIRAAPSAMEVPRLEGVFGSTSELVSLIPDDLFDRYMAEVGETRPQRVEGDLRIVYTPLHGVGGAALIRLLETNGHRDVTVVPEQFEPDGTFPTVAFPNPEEPGALDMAMDLARKTDADLVIANDPDADRLAAAVREAEEWTALSGNDLGCLLADYMLRGYNGTQTPMVISSIVSSPMLGRLATIRGARHESTLTGFKWIINAGLALEEAGEGRFVFGYEEALGYSVGRVVRDKDGMSAALMFCDLVAILREQGKTVGDHLTALWGEVGVWVSTQMSIGGTVDVLRRSVEALATNPPRVVDEIEVESVVDYRLNAATRPFWLGAQDLIELSLGKRGRILVRPSGTEPKLKIYVDLTEELGETPSIQHEMLMTKARAVAQVLGKSLRL